MRASDPSLQFHDVTASYGGPPVLCGVSAHVGRGEVVGVIGPNGSGKTTLIRVASRALRPASGTVTVNGRDPYAISAREAARLVAVVPQDLVPVFSFTALEVALTGRTPYRSWWGKDGANDWVRARAAMQTTGVADLADRPFEELSGGERQRVILAQALAQDAPVLLLDEPTTHLDIAHAVGIVNVVRRLAADEDRAVLAIFHDLNLAAAACDRVYALHDGVLVAEGEPEAVLTPELLRSVYGVDAAVIPDPATRKPVVSLGSLVGPVTPRPATVRSEPSAARESQASASPSAATRRALQPERQSRLRAPAEGGSPGPGS